VYPGDISPLNIIPYMGVSWGYQSIGSTLPPPPEITQYREDHMDLGIQHPYDASEKKITQETYRHDEHAHIQVGETAAVSGSQSMCIVVISGTIFPLDRTKESIT
jgi:hypothetical protein